MGYYSYLIPSSSSSSSIIIPILITSYLLIPIAFSVKDTELGYKCLPSTKPFTSNYSDSRQLVVEKLITNTPSRGGFWIALDEWPRDHHDRAYGLSLCRGDVSPDDCLICVYNAALTLINTHCPNNRSAIIWRDYCFLKYSDVDFFGRVDTDNEFSLMGDNMWYRTASPGAVKTFLADLSLTAFESPGLYAHGTADIMDFPGSFTVYGVAQCTRDIPKIDCWACLNTTVDGLANLKRGGRVVFGSCNMRYEIYNFLSSYLINPPTTAFIK